MRPFLCLLYVIFLGTAPQAKMHTGLILIKESIQALEEALHHITIPEGCACQYAALRYPLHVTLSSEAFLSETPNNSTMKKHIHQKACALFPEIERPLEVKKVAVFSRHKKKAWVVLEFKEQKLFPEKAHVSLYKCKRQTAKICAAQLKEAVENQLDKRTQSLKGRDLRFTWETNSNQREVYVLSPETCSHS